METLMTPQRAHSEISLPPSVLTLIASYQRSAPVDVNGLAKKLGLAVYEDRNMPIGISGKIMKDSEHGGESGYSIVVNPREALVRRRFTVAHEIAHYLLHKNSIGDGLTDNELYRSGLPTLQEVHANRVAADILMPYALIESAISEGKNTIGALAEALMVSPQAMSIRLGVPT